MLVYVFSPYAGCTWGPFSSVCTFARTTREYGVFFAGGLRAVGLLRAACELLCAPALTTLDLKVACYTMQRVV